jgi:molecular chaperone GrpE
MENNETDPIATQLEDLTDLFRRRLLDDREKQRAFDALYAELQQARKITEGEWLRPIARRLFGVIDRLDAESSDFSTSIAEELIALLETYDFIDIAASGGAFDPTTQEVGRTVDGGREQVGVVSGLLRRGWRQGDRVIRPALVEVVREPDVLSLDSSEGI